MLEWAFIPRAPMLRLHRWVGFGGERSEAVLQPGNRSFPSSECTVNSNTSRSSRSASCLRDRCYWTAVNGASSLSDGQYQYAAIAAACAAQVSRVPARSMHIHVYRPGPRDLAGCKCDFQLLAADGYRDTLRRLREAYFDELDTFLVERIALFMVRLRRIPRLEAELVTSILHPPIYQEALPPSFFAPTLIDPGQPARIGSAGVEDLVRYQRYESANENKLYRAMNQLERIRRIQQGEYLPAPVAVDVAVHSESPGVDSTGTVPNLVLESSQFASAHRGHEACTEGASAIDTSGQHPSEVIDSTKPTEEPD